MHFLFSYFQPKPVNEAWVEHQLQKIEKTNFWFLGSLEKRVNNIKDKALKAEISTIQPSSNILHLCNQIEAKGNKLAQWWKSTNTSHQPIEKLAKWSLGKLSVSNNNDKNLVGNEVIEYLQIASSTSIQQKDKERFIREWQGLSVDSAKQVLSQIKKESETISLERVEGACLERFGVKEENKEQFVSDVFTYLGIDHGSHGLLMDNVRSLSVGELQTIQHKPLTSDKLPIDLIRVILQGSFSEDKKQPFKERFCEEIGIKDEERAALMKTTGDVLSSIDIQKWKASSAPQREQIIWEKRPITDENKQQFIEHLATHYKVNEESLEKDLLTSLNIEELNACKSDLYKTDSLITDILQSRDIAEKTDWKKKFCSESFPGLSQEVLEKIVLLEGSTLLRLKGKLDSSEATNQLSSIFSSNEKFIEFIVHLDGKVALVQSVISEMLQDLDVGDLENRKIKLIQAALSTDKELGIQKVILQHWRITEENREAFIQYFLSYLGEDFSSNIQFVQYLKDLDIAGLMRIKSFIYNKKETLESIITTQICGAEKRDLIKEFMDAFGIDPIKDLEFLRRCSKYSQEQLNSIKNTVVSKIAEDGNINSIHEISIYLDSIDIESMDSPVGCYTQLLSLYRVRCPEDACMQFLGDEKIDKATRYKALVVISRYFLSVIRETPQNSWKTIWDAFQRCLSQNMEFAIKQRMENFLSDVPHLLYKEFVQSRYRSTIEKRGDISIENYQPIDFAKTGLSWARQMYIHTRFQKEMEGKSFSLSTGSRPYGEDIAKKWEELSKEDFSCLFAPLEEKILVPGITMDKEQEFKGFIKVVKERQDWPLYNCLYSSREKNFKPEEVAVHGISNWKQNDYNRCFLNAAFQFVMHSPALIQSLENAIVGILFSENSKLSNETKIAYQSFLRAIGDYRQRKGVDLSGLRNILPDLEERELGAMGDSAALLTALFHPLQALASNALKTTFPVIMQEDTYIKSKEVLEGKKNENYSHIPASGVIEKVQQDILITCAASSKIEDIFAKHSVSDEGATFVDKEEKLHYYAKKEKQSILKNSPDQIMINIVRTSVNDQTPIKLPPTIQGNKITYALASAVLRPTPSHYTAMMKYGDTWFYADDARITSTLTEETKDMKDRLEKNVVLCLYEKIKS